MDPSLEPEPLRNGNLPEDLDPFVYQSLNSKDLIRLLRFRTPSAASRSNDPSTREPSAPATSDQAATSDTNSDQCYELVVVSLDALPPFEAISYAWGSAEQTHCIRLRNAAFLPNAELPATSPSCEPAPESLPASSKTIAARLTITTSLAIALPPLIHKSHTGHLWIDQICINQCSIPERNHQVTLMGRIYSGAQRVLIWTGLDCPALGRVAGRLLVGSKSTDSDHSASPSSHPSPDEQVTKVRREEEEELDAVALCDFFSRPWFERAWVVQEAALARDVVVIAGGLELNLKEFQRITHLWQRMLTRRDRKTEVLRLCVAKKRFVDVLVEFSTGGSKPFHTILNQMAPHETSNPRDHVYAFLGIKAEDDIELVPDYALSTSHIFAAAARAIISGTRTFGLFDFLPVGLKNGTGSSSRAVNDLPSWVPNWAIQVDNSPLTRHLGLPTTVEFDACKGFLHRYVGPHGVPDTDSWNTLSVLGGIVDVVDKSLFSPWKWTHSVKPGESRGLSLPIEIVALMDEGKLLGTPDEVIKRVFRACVGNWLVTRPHGVSTIRLGWALNEIVESIASDGVEPGSWAPIIYRLNDMAYHSVFLAGSGKLGLGPNTLKPGDEIAILHGSTLPLVLRPLGRGQYSVIGQCYLESMMYGDGVTWDEDDAERFVLI